MIAHRSPSPDYHPPDPGHIPHRVLIHKGAFVDESRGGRDVPYKVYYPSEEGLARLPVVIWSHGLGGSRDGAAFLTRFLAGQGYVVINIQHHGTDSGLWEGKPGHPWDVIRNTHIPREASLSRFRDVPFVLDQLPRLAAEKPELGTLMDPGTIGMSGHSFGALTTQVAAGQLFPDLDDKLISLAEERIRAGILYSFVPMGHLSDAPPQELFEPMRIPLLFMTGTADDSPVEHFDYTYRLPVFAYAGCPEKYLLVLEEGDHMVFAGSRGQLGENPRRLAQENIIKVLSLAFWDAYLKDNRAAKDWLAGAGPRNWLGDEGQFTYKRR